MRRPRTSWTGAAGGISLCDRQMCLTAMLGIMAVIFSARHYYNKANEAQGIGEGQQWTTQQMVKSRQPGLDPDLPGLLIAWADPRLAYRLGRNASEEDVTVPGRVGGALMRVGVMGVAASGHTLAIGSDGHVYSFGRDWDRERRHAGQLGRPGSFLTPAPVEGELRKKVVVDVAAGRFHSVALTEDGVVYTWGSNERGQLGRPTDRRTDSLSPRPVSDLKGKRVVKVAAGRYHTMVVLETGEVYTWGLNWFHYDVPWKVDKANEDPVAVAEAIHFASHPRKIGGGLEGQIVVDVACGHDHWLALTVDGHVYTCSTGFDGDGHPASDSFASAAALGRGGGDYSPTSPGRVAGKLRNSKKVAVAAGRGVSFAVTETRELYSWGTGCLGRKVSSAAGASRPGRIMGSLLKEKVVAVAAGDGFALALSGEGRVFSWGSNEFQVLGRRTKSAVRPGLLKVLKDVRVLRIAAGLQHALAVGIPSIPGTSAQVEVAEPAGEEVDADAELPIIAEESPQSSVEVAPFIEESAEELEEEQDLARKLTPFNHGSIFLFKSKKLEKSIRALGTEMFEILPSEGYDPAFKNPCWTATSGAFRCMPAFFMIGASRSGIADLFTRLAFLHDIRQPSNKSPSWWDLRSAEGLDWYLNHFNDAAASIAKHPLAIVGDASDNLLTYSGIAVRGTPSTLVDIPKYISAFLPKAKFIVMLRNPIDRWMSAFFSMPDPVEPQDTAAQFAKVARDDVERLRTCIHEHSSEFCTRSLFLEVQQPIKSLYSEFLEDWLLVFPREQFLVLRFEDYVADTRGALEQVIKFLDLRKPSQEVWDKMLNHPVKTGRPRGVGEVVDPETESLLKKFFKPYNIKLARMLKDKKFVWRDDKTRA